MAAWLIGMALALSQPAAAQTGSSGVFVDAAIMADRDPTDAFYGTDVGIAGRGAIGLQLSPRNGVRFELDVPRWRTTAATFDRTTVETSVRSISYSFLYARSLPEAGRLQLAFVAGGGIEDRQYRNVTDALSYNQTRQWFAGVVGADAEVRVTSHLSVAPQFRFHFFPYPQVSIVRPGVAVRWRF